MNGLEMQTPNGFFLCMEQCPSSQPLRTTDGKAGIRLAWCAPQTSQAYGREAQSPPAPLPGLPFQTLRRAPTKIHFKIVVSPPPSHYWVMGCPLQVSPSIFNFSTCPANLSETEGPTQLPGQDSLVLSSLLPGPQWQAAFGGGSSLGTGAAGEWSHRAVCIGKGPHLGSTWDPCSAQNRWGQ